MEEGGGGKSQAQRGTSRISIDWAKNGEKPLYLSDERVEG